MKDLMNIAVINFVTLWGDKEQNLSRITGYCEAAGKRGADFIVFPETALSGYDTDHDHPRAEMMHTRLAETIPGPSTEAVAEIAKKYGIGTYCQLPIDPDLATAVDAGEIEFVMEDGLDPIVEMLKQRTAEEK